MSHEDRVIDKRERRLYERLTAYLESGEGGPGGHRSAMVADFPDFAGELRDFFDGQERLGRIAARLRRTPPVVEHDRANERGGQPLVAAIEPSRLNTAVSGPDGRFELPVPPKPGDLLVLGPTLDYVSVDKPGGKRLYADAIVPLEARPEGSEHALDIRLRRGVTLRGRILGPDDKPAGSCVLFSRSYRVRGYTLYNDPNLLWCADDRFELPGCDPDRTHTAYLFDAARRLGATVELTRKNATEPATVRLQPRGSARARLVDADGKPLPTNRPQFTYVLTEGAPQEADQVYVSSLGWEVFETAGWEVFGSDETDKDGCITFPALVPGTKYRIHWISQSFADPKPWPLVDFTVGPGEVRDLGVIVIERTRF